MANPSERPMGKGDTPDVSREISPGEPVIGRDGRVMHPNSLRNLSPTPANLPNLRGEGTAGSFVPGSTPHLKHGLRSRHPSLETLEPALDHVIAAVCEGVPVRDEHGEVPKWLHEQVWSAAVKKLRIVRCQRCLAQHGDTDERGRWRPENDALVKETEAYERSLERLAMTVPSHMRAGLDLRRTLDLASLWATEADAEEDAE